MSVPSAARIYDFYLGGTHNFSIDRAIARQAIAIWPDLPKGLRLNRTFLRRAVRYAAARGIDQFLDIGAGIPTVGNVHEVAQTAIPGAKVVYVDNDPVAVAQSRALLGDDPLTSVVEADLLAPQSILDAPAVKENLDFDRPIGLMLVSMLHFVPDSAAPAELVGQLVEALAPGSYLSISHATRDTDPERADATEKIYQQTPTPMRLRTRGEILDFFTHLELVPPGLVFGEEWDPDGDAPPLAGPPQPGFVGVGRKS